jgi:hypothetical protein
MLPHHVPHISMLFWTWETFFIAAAISFLIQVNLNGDTLTFSSFIKPYWSAYRLECLGFYLILISLMSCCCWLMRT